jgi:hypothetical protein
MLPSKVLVAEYIGGAGLQDDITLVAVRRLR